MKIEKIMEEDRRSVEEINGYKNNEKYNLTSFNCDNNRIDMSRTYYSSIREKYKHIYKIILLVVILVFVSIFTSIYIISLWHINKDIEKFSSNIENAKKDSVFLYLRNIKLKRNIFYRDTVSSNKEILNKDILKCSNFLYLNLSILKEKIELSFFSKIGFYFKKKNSFTLFINLTEHIIKRFKDTQNESKKETITDKNTGKTKKFGKENKEKNTNRNEGNANIKTRSDVSNEENPETNGMNKTFSEQLYIDIINQKTIYLSFLSINDSNNRRHQDKCVFSDYDCKYSIVDILAYIEYICSCNTEIYDKIKNSLRKYKSTDHYDNTNRHKNRLQYFIKDNKEGINKKSDLGNTSSEEETSEKETIDDNREMKEKIEEKNRSAKKNIDDNRAVKEKIEVKNRRAKKNIGDNRAVNEKRNMEDKKDTRNKRKIRVVAGMKYRRNIGNIKDRRNIKEKKKESNVKGTKDSRNIRSLKNKKIQRTMKNRRNRKNDRAYKKKNIKNTRNIIDIGSNNDKNVNDCNSNAYKNKYEKSDLQNMIENFNNENTYALYPETVANLKVLKEVREAFFQIHKKFKKIYSNYS
ncbi:hypothetical protein CWI37_0720p0030 [Hamiltosporidium tvaerminnensis]|uniref:Uncharacterized protein n=1 Tax=Hamiltosporidium tvaerminnensis TaxID=1176355 RepID=A0A4Q9L2Y9_9MICR|nr:hypothetical protein CWI37_0720p0030 [Hamiltosporidium tvaerminnensis]